MVECNLFNVWFIKVWTIHKLFVTCFIMTFLANPHFILQISHAKTFEMKYPRCPYNNVIQKIFIKSQRQIMCDLNFYGSDVSCILCSIKYHKVRQRIWPDSMPQPGGHFYPPPSIFVFHVWIKSREVSLFVVWCCFFLTHCLFSECFLT